MRKIFEHYPEELHACLWTGVGAKGDWKTINCEKKDKKSYFNIYKSVNKKNLYKLINEIGGMKMTSIMKIEGIGPAYQKKLVAFGIKTVEALLKQGATDAGREKIAKGTGIAGGSIMEWVNHADLWRIKGVSEEYSDLLEEPGSIPWLSWLNACPRTCSRKWRK